MRQESSVGGDRALADRRVVIIGGSSGIGLACAHSFGASGATVAILARDGQRNARAVAELTAAGVTALSAEADVESESSIADAVTGVAARLGGIDIVVCAAGKAGLGGRDLLGVSVAEWDSQMNVNVRGVWLTVRAALPHLRQGTDPAIVIIGSDSAFVSTEAQVPYCTAKGALVSFTRSLAVDLSGDNVRVNSVCPSIVDTPMSRNSLGLSESGFEGASYPVHRADDIAEVALFLGTPRSRAINGQSLLADFGWSGRSNFPT